MIWHIVRFDFSRLEPEVRADLDAQLAGLAELDMVAYLRVGPDLDDPGVTGLAVAFETKDELEAYRVHPDHLPVVAVIAAVDAAMVRIDMEVAGPVPRG